MFPFLRFRTSIKVVPAIFLILFIASAFSYALADTKSAAPCKFIPNFDPETDLHAIENYRTAIQMLFLNGGFDEIDCLADATRKSKEQFKGGGWKLRNIYWLLVAPHGHATEEDWTNHLERVNRWISKNPESITARIVLAESYTSYAWDARGNGLADTVTESGWRLFRERLDKARQTLDEARALKAKCPEWYAAMQGVALGQGWDLPKETALFQEAVAFEPSYYYYYQRHANYLLPKWQGEEGDTAKFMEASAKQIGGDQGDILYFHIVRFLLCNCASDDLKDYSWPRIKNGYLALERETGVSLSELNEIACIAGREADFVFADQTFKRIGDDWDEHIWKTKAYFNSSKTRAKETAPGMLRDQAEREEADATMKTPEGLAYVKQLEPAIKPIIHKCIQDGGNDHGITEIVVEVANINGRFNVQRLMDYPSESFARCFFDGIHPFERYQGPLLPPPPKPEFWTKWPIPAAIPH